MEINGKALNSEQVVLFQKMTKLQQGVALGVLGGLSQREAYMQAGGKSQGANADVAASQTLRLPKVRAFMDSFRADELKQLSDLVMSRDEMGQTLTSLARDRTEGAQARLGAMKQLAAMLGFDAPVKVENSGTTTTNHRLSDFYASPEQIQEFKKAFNEAM